MTRRRFHFIAAACFSVAMAAAHAQSNDPLGVGRQMREHAPRAVVQPPLVAVEAAPGRLHCFDDFGADRPLPSDDQRVVIGRHQRRAALGDDFLRDCSTVLGVAVVEHDFGAKRQRALALGLGRIGRHHDGGAHAE